MMPAMIKNRIEGKSKATIAKSNSSYNS
jgi:hypothetical protein